MNNLQSPVDMIRLPSASEEQNHLIETLQEKFKAADYLKKLDEGTQASLLNFYLATQVDLSWLGLGKAVHIPVQVAESEGGRKSVYCLDQGEEVLTGIYVTCEGIALSFMKRVSGSSFPAEVGSVYHTRIENRDRKLLFEGEEILQSFNRESGVGSFSTLAGTGAYKDLSPLAGPISPHKICFFNLVCIGG